MPLTLIILSMVVAAAPASSPFVQEGHPMSGTWVGDWGPDPEERHRVVVVMEWTGEALVGTINPGPGAIPMRVATVDPTDWSVHIEADTTDSQGRDVTYVIDGTIDDLGTYNRSIAGTWNAGGTPGDFSITRQ